jgi:hypothetical protein
MKVPSLLALDAGHGPIGQSRIGCSVQGYPNRKAAGSIVSNDLNSGNRFATGPLPYGLKAFFAKRPIVQADRFEFYHLKLLIRNKSPSRPSEPPPPYFPTRLIIPRSITSW